MDPDQQFLRTGLRHISLDALQLRSAMRHRPSQSSSALRTPTGSSVVLLMLLASWGWRAPAGDRDTSFGSGPHPRSFHAAASFAFRSPKGFHVVTVEWIAEPRPVTVGPKLKAR